MQPKFNPTGVRTHNLQIMTVHFILLRNLYSHTCLKRPLKGPLKTGGLLSQLNDSDKCAFMGLKGWSLNTDGLKVYKSNQQCARAV